MSQHGINADALQEAYRLGIATVEEFKSALQVVAEKQRLANQATAELNEALRTLETCRAKALQAKKAVAELGEKSEIADAPAAGPAPTENAVTDA